MPVDDCIEQLDALAEPLRSICLRTPDKGTTEHISAEEAILFLQEILRDRRAVRGSVSKTASIKSAARRKERAITPFNVSVPDVTRDLEKEQADKEAAKEAAAKEKETAESVAQASSSAPIAEQAAAPDAVAAAVPAVGPAEDPMDPRQLEAVALERARRLMEVQAVLDAAQPQEFVGLSIDVHEKRGTIAEYVDGKFKVKFDSGGEIVLDKITAAHLAETLPSWA